MKKLFVLVGMATLAVIGIAGSRLWGVAPASATTASDDGGARTQAVVAAADAFVSSLGPDQRAQAQLAFEPQHGAAAARFPHVAPPGGQPGHGPGAMHPPGPNGPGRGPQDHGPLPGGLGGRPGGGAMPDFVAERYGQAVWSNYPVSDVPRPGVRLGALTAAQRDAAMRLLRTLLSPQGYAKVLEIMGSDQALSDQGQPFASGTAAYTIAIFGDPSTTKPWMVEFGGHHLALNIVIAGPHGVMTPTLTGAQPAVYTANGRTVRALAAENDTAFALLGALDASQRKQAILSYRIDDLVAGPGHAGETIVPEGVKGSAMTGAQRALMMAVIAQWAGMVDGAYAAPRMKEIEAGLDDTWFAWSGPTTHQPGRNGSSYYRIQGPKLLIEFSPQGVGGDATMHVHTMYRDPTNDYGVAYTLR